MLNKLKNINWRYELKGLYQITKFIVVTLFWAFLVQQFLWLIVTGNLHLTF